MIKYCEINNGKYILRGLHNKLDNPKGLVILFHGFTGHLNENGYLFKQITEVLEKENLETIRFDFYGSGISDGFFNEMTFKTELLDASSIIEYALSINQNRQLIVLGFSCGAAVSALTTLKFQDKISKLILISPAGNMDLIAESKTLSPQTKWVDSDNFDMGGYTMNKAFYESFNDINLYENIENFTKSVLIIHGELDKSVPISYGIKYANTYKNSKFIMISGSDHCYQKVEYRKELMEHITNFLKD